MISIRQNRIQGKKKYINRNAKRFGNMSNKAINGFH